MLSEEVVIALLDENCCQIGAPKLLLEQAANAHEA